jgi:hypothetical protein
VEVLRLKLGHLKDKDVTQFPFIKEKEGNRIEERKKGGKEVGVVLMYNATSAECRISQNFMESKGLLYSQELTPVLLPDPNESSLHPPIGSRDN